MTLSQAALLVVGGGAAGFINTLAGGGSAITIPILEAMVGINTANGSNRIAILAANLSAVTRFQRGEAIPWRRVAPLLVPVVLGAGVGAWLATLTDPELLRTIFAAVLIMVAASVLLKPSRWLDEREDVLPEPWRFLVFLGIGVYGGFVQAGVGFLLLGGLVLGGGMNLVTGNAAKVVLVAIYTPIALVLFVLAGQVDFLVGGVLAVGQMSGAWIAAHLALEKGAPWVRWVLVVAAVLAAIRLLVA